MCARSIAAAPASRSPGGGPRRRRARCARPAGAQRPAALAVDALRPTPLHLATGARRPHGDLRPRRASRARQARAPLGRAPAATSRAPPAAGEHRLHLLGRAAERRGGLPQLGRQPLELDRDVEADAEHRPALLGAPLDEDPRELREAVGALDDHVVGPLDQRPLTGRPRSRRRPRISGSSVRRRAQQQRHQQRAARWRLPAPSLAAAPGALLGRRSRASRAARRPAASSRARSLVEPVRRRCTRGWPSVERCPGRTWRRSRRLDQQLRVALHA